MVPILLFLRCLCKLVSRFLNVKLSYPNIFNFFIGSYIVYSQANNSNLPFYIIFSNALTLPKLSSTVNLMAMQTGQYFGSYTVEIFYV